MKILRYTLLKCIFGSLLLLFVIPGSPFAQLPPAAGLKAYWSFDNCDGRDDSGLGHTGTLFANPSCVSGGTPAGHALEFDANKWVKVTSTSDIKFAPGSSFTLSAFVKPQTRNMLLCDETGMWCMYWFSGNWSSAAFAKSVPSDLLSLLDDCFIKPGS